MSKLRGRSPPDDEVWTERGELRKPEDRSDQPAQDAPRRAPRTPAARPPASTPAAPAGKDGSRK